MHYFAGVNRSNPTRQMGRRGMDCSSAAYWGAFSCGSQGLHLIAEGSPGVEFESPICETESAVTYVASQLADITFLCETKNL